MLKSQGSGIESNGCTCEAIGWLWRGINTLRLLFGAALYIGWEWVLRIVAFLPFMGHI